MLFPGILVINLSERNCKNFDLTLTHFIRNADREAMRKLRRYTDEGKMAMNGTIKKCYKFRLNWKILTINVYFFTNKMRY